MSKKIKFTGVRMSEEDIANIERYKLEIDEPLSRTIRRLLRWIFKKDPNAVKKELYDVRGR